VRRPIPPPVREDHQTAEVELPLELVPLLVEVLGQIGRGLARARRARSSRATDRWGAPPSPASSVVQGDRSVGGSPEPGELGRPGRPIGGGLARARRDRSSRATGAIVNGSRSAAGHTGLAHPEAVHARLHPHPGPRRGRRDEVDLVRRDLWSKGVASRAWHPSAPFGSHASVVHVRGTCTSELAGSSE
jgi:hypothetical protein